MTSAKRRRGALSRRQATQVKLVSQLVFAVAALAAVTAVVLWPRTSPDAVTGASFAVEDVQSRATARAAEAAEQAASREVVDDSLPMDPEGLAWRLQLAGRVTPPEPPAPEETMAVPDAGKADETPEPAEAPPPASAVSRYLGLVSAGSSAWALVGVGNTQGMLRVGGIRTFEFPADVPPLARNGEDELRVELTDVDAEAMVVLENGVQFRVEKAARSSNAIAMADDTEAGRRNAQPSRPNRASDMPARPRAEDFRDESGELDREAYRDALRDYSRKARQSLSNPRGRPEVFNGSQGGSDGNTVPSDRR